MTIAEAAAEVLRSEQRPLALESILNLIKLRDLYKFNSPDELTILREQMRRHCELPDKKLQYEPTLFSLNEAGLFALNTLEPNRHKITTMRRIRRASDKEDVIECLSKRGNAIFPEMWRLLVFAATIGLHAKQRDPVDKYESGKTIDYTSFAGCSAWPGLVHLMGLVETQDPRVLNPDQDQMDFRITLFEEYANAGLRLMRDAGESRDYSLDSLIGLMPVSEPGSVGSSDQSQI